MITRGARNLRNILMSGWAFAALCGCAGEHAASQSGRGELLTRGGMEALELSDGGVRSASRDGGGGDSGIARFGAEHAAADVDWLLDRSGVAPPPSGDAPTSASTWNERPFGAAAAPPFPPPTAQPAGAKVIFNDPNRASTRRGGDDAPPPAGQSNLFRDADKPVDVLPLATDAARSPELLRPDRIGKLIVDLSRELYAEGAYSDMPLRELLAISALSMIDPQRKLDAAALPDLSERERELLASLQDFFIALGEQLDGSADADAVINDALAALRQSLVTEPQLEIQTVALCTRVSGFGDFDEIGRRSFLAHAEEKFALYLEIANFTSELNLKEQWITELSLQLVIYAERDGIPVWRQDWQPAVDRSKQKRTDFFIAQRITLPAALSVGKYDLKIRVRDDKSGAIAETGVPLEMVADENLTRE